MRKGTGIAGATLLYGPQAEEPDLLLAMQLVLDDLRGDGRRIGAVRLTASTLRLRADPFDLVLTLAAAPLSLAATRGLLRPRHDSDSPDFARLHLSRMLRFHRHALGFLLRRRGAPIDANDAAETLAREGQLCLLPVIAAAPPALLIWQPGGLVLTADEFRAADPAMLLLPGDTDAPLRLPPADRLDMARPGPITAPDPPAAAPLTRTAISSTGRAFGGDPATNRRHLALPGLDRTSDRLAQALRQTPAAPPPRPAALRAIWAVLLPLLGAMGGLS